MVLFIILWLFGHPAVVRAQAVQMSSAAARWEPELMFFSCACFTSAQGLASLAAVAALACGIPTITYYFSILAV